MKDKFDLFEIMQNYEPDEYLIKDKTNKQDVERIKFLSFKKKGKDYMKFKLSRIAVAVAAVMIVFGSTVGVNAATDGAVVKSVSKVLHFKVVDENGNAQEKDIEATENSDGSYEFEVPFENSDTVIIDGKVDNSAFKIEAYNEKDSDCSVKGKIKTDKDSAELEVEIEEKNEKK